MTLRPSVSGFSSSRKYRLVAVPLDDLRAEFAAKFTDWRRGGFNTMLLDQQLVKLSLKGTGTTPELVEAWANAYVGEGDPSSVALNAERYEINHDDMMAYAREVFRRYALIWQYPPYNDPDIIIYDANVRTYVCDVIYIEVQYRHGL